MNKLCRDALKMQTALLDIGFENVQLSFINGRYYIESNSMMFDRGAGVCVRLIAQLDDSDAVTWSQLVDPSLKRSFDAMYEQIKHVVINRTTQGMP